MYTIQGNLNNESLCGNGVGIYLLLWQDTYDGVLIRRHFAAFRPGSAHRLLNRTRLGVKTRVFHLGDYRRENLGHGQEVPDDYFFVNGK